MAFPVAARSTGTLITASIWNADLKDNLNTLYAGGLALTSQAALSGIYATSSTQWAAVALAAKQSQRVNVGGTAHEAFVAPQVYATTIADVANTTSETTTASFTMPANEMVAGDAVDIIMAVLAKNNKGSSGAVTIKFHWGATSVTAGNDSWANIGSERQWLFRFHMMRVGSDLWIRRRKTSMTVDSDFNLGYLDLTTEDGDVVSMTPTFSSSATVALKVTFDAADANFYWKTQSARVIRYPNG